ncbi:ATP-binding cassette domain-containing protein [Corynebacterium sp.]|uniref:ATP-binding cassette domain-containing protein n=1 Tax=Corynebacterium sp. TaxID=1720 RepID=UPI0026DD5E16|nr:ATP-binding cassette domain-containing protein [Corynebacterium sp.]MDO5031226.1 ATP-binding cassette domain-containing protein [Corynebacterium sp.]
MAENRTHPTLTLSHVAAGYGSDPILQDISLELRGGKVFALLGRNGVGKSTLLSTIVGLITPTAGRIAHTGHIGASINEPALYEHLSALDNLLVHTRLLGLPRAEAGRALRVVGLDARSRAKVKTFSTGMRARLALAQAILGDPEILILDEPHNGLDPQGIAQLRVLLRSWAREGRLVIVSSHQLGEVLHLADDVAILAAGRISYSGPLEELAPEGNLEEEFFRLSALEGSRA